MNEVIGGKIVKENETGEAKKFRQEIVASIKKQERLQKKKESKIQ